MALQDRSAAAEFWLGDNEHQDLAKMFERHIEQTSPNSVKEFGYRSTWAATTVTYYEYHGPSI